MTSDAGNLRFCSDCISELNFAEIIMKTSAFLALLFIGGIVFYVTGGGALLGLGGTTSLPDTITPPNATFFGNEQENPFAE